jgi:hypothetical protein
MVTPLRDSMNLTAKKYVAAQDAADPGVLIFSEFAGAAEELTDTHRQSLQYRRDSRRDQERPRNESSGAARASWRAVGCDKKARCCDMVSFVPRAP